jgi:hypothetical protein
MSNEAFYRQRRSLNIISIALIFYFMTGVEFSQDGMVLNSLAITIEHQVIAYAFVWIAFFYFWWRFYLFGEDVRRRWQMNFLYLLSKNEKYRSLYSQPEGVGQNEPTVWAPSLHGEGFRRYLSWEEAYLVGVRMDDGQIQLASPSTFRDSINPVMQKWSVGPDTIIPLKWRKYFLPALKANLSAMTSKSGTDWALPNFMACFALICGVVSLATIIRS